MLWHSCAGPGGAICWIAPHKKQRLRWFRGVKPWRRRRAGSRQTTVLFAIRCFIAAINFLGKDPLTGWPSLGGRQSGFHVSCARRSRTATLVCRASIPTPIKAYFKMKGTYRAKSRLFQKVKVTLKYNIDILKKCIGTVFSSTNIVYVFLYLGKL